MVSTYKIPNISINNLDDLYLSLSGGQLSGSLFAPQISTSNLFTDCGNSEEWCSTYTIVQSNSAHWSDHANITEVQSTSGDWTLALTTVQSNSADWSDHANITEVQSTSGDWNNTTTTVQSNSGFWNGDFQNSIDLNCNSINNVAGISACNTTDTITITGNVTIIGSLSTTEQVESVADNFIFAIDTTTQTIVTPNTWQVFNFSTNVILAGWTHVPNTGTFTCEKTGFYGITVEYNVERNGGGANAIASIRALLNGNEILGSHSGTELPSNNTPYSLSRTFILSCNTNDIITTQFSGDKTQVSVRPAPTAAAVSNAISATITIRRLT